MMNDQQQTNLGFDNPNYPSFNNNNSNNNSNNIINNNSNSSSNNLISNNNNIINSSSTSPKPPIDASLSDTFDSILRNIPANSSLKQQRKMYSMGKRNFTKYIQSAIESTQEVHSGWLKARSAFKRWTKVWCQVKPGYLVMYTSQEAQKKHRLGVVLLSVCQVLKRPTKKEGFCFKLINPFGCSVWAKSSTRALAFSQASLTLRASDPSIGKIWLDSLHRCNLAVNLNGYQSVIDQDKNSSCNRSALSDSDDGECSTRYLENIMLKPSNNNGSHSNSISSLSECQLNIGRPLVNGSKRLNTISSVSSKNSHNNDVSYELDVNDNKNFQNTTTKIEPHNLVGSKTLANDLNMPEARLNLQRSKLVADNKLQTNIANKNLILDNDLVKKFRDYSWKELKLEKVSYQGDGLEELGVAGVQSEEVQEGNKNFLWHIIKQLRPGMDLSKVTLPTFILEPRSFLEKLADYYYHCDILSDAVMINDPVIRLLNIVKWYLSGFYKKPKGPKKPYNPILGERFRCFWEHPKTHSRTFFVAEQVSHHPPISAFHVSNRKDGYTITCALLSRSKFSGNSVSAILDGKAKLHLTKRGETYTLTMPHANCRGILLGSLCMELGGKVEIECAETGCKCELDFKLAPVWAGSNSYNSLTGKILKANKVTHTLDGHWDKKINIVDKRTDEKSVLWEVTDSVRSARLKRYTVAIKDQEERESVRLWSKVTEALSVSDQTNATAEKTRLEDMQRQEARERKGTFVPQSFEFKQDVSDWVYRWQDDRRWNEIQDIMQFEENFKIRTLVIPSEKNEPNSSGPFGHMLACNETIDLPITLLSMFCEQMDSSEGSKSNEGLQTVSNTSKSKNKHENRLDPSTFKNIESRMDAENMLMKQAIKQVTEKSKKLEEDLAKLKRGKKLGALIVAAIIIAILSIIFKYFT